MTTVVRYFVFVFIFCALFAGCSRAAQPVFNQPTRTETPPDIRQPAAATAAPLEPSPEPRHEPGFPLRMALYHIWDLEQWAQAALLPARAPYESRDPQVLQAQIEEMRFAGIAAGLLRWSSSQDDETITAILDLTNGRDFRWAVHLDERRQGVLDEAQTNASLDHIGQAFSAHPAYLHLDGRFVVLVSLPPERASCALLSRLRAGSSQPVYLILQTFRGFALCRDQADAWINLGGAEYPAPPAGDSITLSVRPPQTHGDLRAWEQEMLIWGAQAASLRARGARLEVIDSYNGWLRGSGLEPAREWPYSGQAYLDVLRQPAPDYAAVIRARAAGEQAVLVGAGDIAICAEPGAEITAAMLDSLPGTVFTAGDNSNEFGSRQNYLDCFDPTWGRHKDRIYPAAGNHDYYSEIGKPYFEYFGARAGLPSEGYYAFDLGAWRVIVLNSQCEFAGGCAAGAPQLEWLRSEVEENPRRCTLAIWHYPLFTSSARGGYAVVRPFWRILYEAGTDVILNGHDHHYERFAPQDPFGNRDEERGVRQFIIGTGGGGLRPVAGVADNSEAQILFTYGLLKLTLHSGSYDWEFIPQPGRPGSDSGSAACH